MRRAAAGSGQQADQETEASPATPAAKAEQLVRARIQENLDGAQVQNKTGQLQSLSPWWKGVQQSGGWLEPACSNPLNNPAAGIEDYYKYFQCFNVHHPLVSGQPGNADNYVY